jgi:hypothetical protein
MIKLKAWQYLLETFLLLCAIGGCKPNSADLPTIALPAGQVGFYNLIPSQALINPYPGAINMYVNGTRQNTNKIAYGDFSGYMAITSGAQNIVFKSDSLRTEIYPSTSITLDTLNTTLFVTGKANAASVTIIHTRDTAVTDAVNIKPKFRFVHASADAPAFDLVLVGVKSSVTINNQSYKSISAFNRADTGKVAFKLNLAGTSTKVLSGTLTLTASNVYTMYVYGVYAGGANSITWGLRNGY